ncbi:MAG: polysaccharide pyruvyl transferase family protein [Pseudomonadota bacterium]
MVDISEPIKLYHWPAANFGDALSRDVVAHVSRRDVVQVGPKQAQLFALGSLMHVISKFWTDRSRPANPPILWGTGVLNPFWRRDFLENVQVALFRGPISAALMRMKHKRFGDPGLLAPYVFGPVAQTDRVVVIPHHSQADDPEIAAMVASDAALTLIDPRQDAEPVCRAIAGASHVISASLHGLIVADAYGVPNTWMDPGEQGFLKYHDYAASIGRKMLAPVEITEAPAVARRAKTHDLPYAAGIAAAREALLTTFPAQFKATHEIPA